MSAYLRVVHYMTAFIQVWRKRLFDSPALCCLVLDRRLLTFMGQNIRVVLSRYCGEVGHLTGLEETDCCGLGMTKLEETVYGGLSI